MHAALGSVHLQSEFPSEIVKIAMYLKSPCNPLTGPWPPGFGQRGRRVGKSGAARHHELHDAGVNRGDRTQGFSNLSEVDKEGTSTSIQAASGETEGFRWPRTDEFDQAVESHGQGKVGFEWRSNSSK